VAEHAESQAGAVLAGASHRMAHSRVATCMMGAGGRASGVEHLCMAAHEIRLPGERHS
jgi:hypothetical protein